MHMRINLTSGKYIDAPGATQEQIDSITQGIGRGPGAYVMHMADKTMKILNTSHIVDVDVTP